MLKVAEDYLGLQMPLVKATPFIGHTTTRIPSFYSLVLSIPIAGDSYRYCLDSPDDISSSCYAPRIPLTPTIRSWSLPSFPTLVQRAEMRVHY
jgi:hypothetical protein